jgi:hypothetical protein
MAISDRVKRRLWASSAGVCQNPGCRKDLFKSFADGAITSIDELAHVIARMVNGPRGNGRPPSTERDEFENIIVLCPSCHTLVDKAPHQFPPAMLLKWKESHVEAVKRVLLTPVCKDRPELRRAVRVLLERNRGIFDTYGPHSTGAADPLAEAAKQWQRLLLTEILPNNRKVAALLEANSQLLTEGEHKTLRAFIVHAEALEYNRVSGEKNPVAPVFPKGMNGILE